MQRFIASPYDLVHQQKDQIAKIHTQLSAIDQAMVNNTNQLNVIKAKLPFLTGEVTELASKLQLFQVTHTLRATTTALDIALSKKLESANAIDEKIHTNELEKEKLLIQHGQAKKVWLQGSKLLQDKSALFLAKLASKKNQLGTGMDIVEHEITPQAETQLVSIEEEIRKIDNVIQSLKQDRANNASSALSLVMQQNETLAEINQRISALTEQKKILEKNIQERMVLKNVAEAQSLHGIAVRGHSPSLNDLLSINQKDNYGHTPLYYACRCGHPELVVQLVDFAKLSKSEEEELIAILPKTDMNAYSRMLSALKNKNTYDRLWDDKASLGTNIITVFQDYYRPKILEQLDMIPDAGKRLLTLNWNHKHIELAKDLVTLFTLLDPELKQDKSFCQKLIGSKWNSFFAANPDPNDPFARRLYYVKNKMEGHELKNEKRKVSVAKLGLLADNQNHNAIEMNPLSADAHNKKMPGIRTKM